MSKFQNNLENQRYHDTAGLMEYCKMFSVHSSYLCHGTKFVQIHLRLGIYFPIDQTCLSQH